MATLTPISTRSEQRSASPMLWLCLAATWLVWGSTYLAIKFALLSFPPFLQMGSRFLLAGLLLACWMRARGSRWPALREWRNSLVVGALMLGGGMGGTAHAELSIGSGLVVAFVAVIPLLIALLNLGWGIRPSRLEAAGMAFGLLGVLWLTQGQGLQSSPSGLTAMVIACGCWSLGSVLSQRCFKLAAGAMGFASEMIAGGCVLMLLAAFSGERWAWPPQPLAVGAWLYLVVFGSLIAFNAYMWLLAHASAGVAASYTFVNPLIAIMLGVAFAGETVTSGEWGAAALILVGVLLTLLPRFKRDDAGR